MSAQQYLLDSSSLINIVRYYHPFNKSTLKGYMESCFQTGSFLFLEAVKKEVSIFSRNLVMKEYDFLAKLPLTPSLEMSPDLQDRMDREWIVARNYELRTNRWRKAIERGDEESEAQISARIRRLYDDQKKEMIGSGDTQLILAAMQDRAKSVIVTEESEAPGQKLFKKIPVIARQEGIECINAVEMFRHLGVRMTIHTPDTDPAD